MIPTIWARANVRKDGAPGVFYAKGFILPWSSPTPPAQAILTHIAQQGYEFNNIIAWEIGYADT